MYKLVRVGFRFGLVIKGRPTAENGPALKSQPRIPWRNSMVNWCCSADGQIQEVHVLGIA